MKLRDKLLEELSKGSFSISQLMKRLKKSYSHIYINLQLLEAMGKVEREWKGGSFVWRLKK